MGKKNNLPATWCHISQQSSLNIYCCENTDPSSKKYFLDCSSFEADGDLRVCIVYAVWLYWKGTQYWTQNCMIVEYNCLYHRSHPQLLQSVVDLGFQYNLPPFLIVSGYCLPVFHSCYM